MPREMTFDLRRLGVGSAAAARGAMTSARPGGSMGACRGPRSVLFALAGLFLLSACSNYADMLQRAQGYYEADDYERALAVFRHLDPDRGALEEDERVRYFYLRGMTDYRLGYHADARYWLGLAEVSLKQPSSALREDEVQRLQDTLDDLNRPLFGIEEDAQPAPVAAPIPCLRNTDCGKGLLCLEGLCRPTEEAVDVELSSDPPTEPAEPSAVVPPEAAAPSVVPPPAEGASPP